MLDAPVNKLQSLNSALSTNAGKSIRAEDLEHYEDFFVDPINSATLEENTNQLIYGRRGSGKTLLFGTLNDRIRAGFPASRTVSFYYSATEFRSSAEFGGFTPTVKEKTHAFFHSFLQQLCNDIFDLADSIFRKPGWLEALMLGGDSHAQKRDMLVDRALRLLEAAAVGSDSPLPSSVSLTVENASSTRKSRSRSGSMGISFPQSGAGLPIQGEVQLGQAGEASTETTQKIVYGAGRAFSPARVRELLVEIVDLLELDYFVIFVDEWMSLADCQIEFAERLRQCLFGDRRLAVKIAADQFQGQFNNAGRGHHFRGIDVGGDIFPAVDLDEPFRDPSRFDTLFPEVLYRRLLKFEPSLEDYFGSLPLRNPGLFIDNLFETRHAFNELCKGAQGLCRDFHAIFRDCTKRINLNLENGRITFDIVQSVLVERTNATYERAMKSTDSNPALVDVIMPFVRDTGSRQFLLASQLSRFSPIIDDLQSKRFIHGLPLSELDPSLKGKYRLFEIDYGIYLDLMRAREFSGRSHSKSQEKQERISAANIDSYLLDLATLDSFSTVAQLLCPTCGTEFSESEKAYVARRICPACFADQPDEAEPT